MPRVEPQDLTAAVRSTFPLNLSVQDIVFVCIGTDRSTGDALGPLVGTYLTRFGYPNVIGTVDDPCHAENVVHLVDSIPQGKKIIAIDACLGSVSSIGTFGVNVGPLRPGAGVGKVLPAVGHYKVTGCVNVGGFMEYFVLQNTRLSKVMEMAEAITAALMSSFPLLEGAREAAASLVD